MTGGQLFTLLLGGAEAWNAWRHANQNVRPDFSEANLSGADLSMADLSMANLSKANLSKAILFRANLSRANLCEANLSGAILFRANLSRANLSEANLSRANLCEANLSGAILSSANLSRANLSEAYLSGAYLTRANLSKANLSGAILIGALLVNTDFRKANLTSCWVYGLSAWDLQLDGAIQKSLRITPPGQPEITVDNLEVAQFIYLLLNNEKIRQVIDTITSKVVLILGRFTPTRIAVLNAIREELRNCDYLPVLFNFEKPSSRDTHETITTLARMARFVIADITEAKSIPQELVSIVEQLPSLPVQPILLHGSEPWGMFDHIRRYHWVLDVHEYRGVTDLLPRLKQTVIAPAEAKVKEQRKRQARSRRP